MAVIKVPKTPRRSFNPDRPPSALLLKQIEHLEWAALPATQRTSGRELATPKVTTEGEAAERIAQLTALIRQHQAQPYTPGESARVSLPPLPGAESSARESASAETRSTQKPARRRPKAATKRKGAKKAARVKASKKAVRSRRTRTTAARKRGARGRTSR